MFWTAPRDAARSGGAKDGGLGRLSTGTPIWTPTGQTETGKDYLTRGLGAIQGISHCIKFRPIVYQKESEGLTRGNSMWVPVFYPRVDDVDIQVAAPEQDLIEMVTVKTAVSR
jgi:hypothetical protein